MNTLEQIIYDFWLNMTDSSQNNSYEDVKNATIHQIDQYCNRKIVKARIEELERILTKGNKRRRYIREPSAVVVERIAELKVTLKELREE